MLTMNECMMQARGADIGCRLITSHTLTQEGPHQGRCWAGGPASRPRCHDPVPRFGAKIRGQDPGPRSGAGSLLLLIIIIIIIKGHSLRRACLQPATNTFVVGGLGFELLLLIFANVNHLFLRQLNKSYYGTATGALSSEL